MVKIKKTINKFFNNRCKKRQMNFGQCNLLKSRKETRWIKASNNMKIILNLQKMNILIN